MEKVLLQSVGTKNIRKQEQTLFKRYAAGFDKVKGEKTAKTISRPNCPSFFSVFGLNSNCKVIKVGTALYDNIIYNFVFKNISVCQKIVLLK